MSGNYTIDSVGSSRPRLVAAVAGTAASMAASRRGQEMRKSKKNNKKKTGAIGSREKRAHVFFSAGAEVFVGTK